MKTSLKLICGIVSVLISTVVSEAENPPQMYVPDGQLVSHVFRVFVTDEITPEMEPRLSFEVGHVFRKRDPREQQAWSGRVIPHQHWQEEIDGQMVQLEGTLILFDLKNYPIPLFKPAMRVVPSLTWKNMAKEGDEERMLIGRNAVYLANLWHALLLTGVLMVAVVIMIGAWARTKSPQKKAIMLISGPDGYMSLWRAQLAAWTVVVGAAVFCFGMIRLAVPEIPETLIVLMGMSLATGAWSAAKSRSDASAKLAKKVVLVPKSGPPAFDDLIGDFDSGLDRVLISLPKAQMVFWTVLMLVLFVGKTLVEGQLWNVPWQLVTLTGFSQAGYIGDKYTKSSHEHSPDAQALGAGI